MNEKRKTKKALILELLSDGQRHSMRELNRIAFRYGARIWELNREGYVIEAIKVGDDSYDYRMVLQERQGALI